MASPTNKKRKIGELTTPGFSVGFNNPDLSDRILHITVESLALNPSALASHFAPKRITRASSKRKASSEESDKNHHSPPSPSRLGHPAEVMGWFPSCYHVNSLLLISESTYFKKLFLGEFKERTEKQVEIQLKDDERPAFDVLLRYIYTKKLELPSDSDNDDDSCGLGSSSPPLSPHPSSAASSSSIAISLASVRRAGGTSSPMSPSPSSPGGTVSSVPLLLLPSSSSSSSSSSTSSPSHQEPCVPIELPRAQTHMLQLLVRVLVLADRLSTPAVFQAAVDEMRQVLSSTSSSSQTSQTMISLVEFTLSQTKPYLELPTFQPVFEVCQSTLSGHFKDFERRHGDVLHLSTEALTLLIASNEIVVRSENTVWSAVMRWMHQNKKSLGEALPVLSQVRYGCMTSDYLTQIAMAAMTNFSDESRATKAYCDLLKNIQSATVYALAIPARKAYMRSQTSMQFILSRAVEADEEGIDVELKFSHSDIKKAGKRVGTPRLIDGYLVTLSAHWANPTNIGNVRAYNGVAVRLFFRDPHSRDMVDCDFKTQIQITNCRGSYKCGQKRTMGVMLPGDARQLSPDDRALRTIYPIGPSDEDWVVIKATVWVSIPWAKRPQGVANLTV